jgi:hypothetical protein
MTKKPQQDVNQVAARVLAEATARHEKPLDGDVEAVWASWIAGVGRVDERAKALLRAAFEVGVEVGRRVTVTK